MTHQELIVNILNNKQTLTKLEKQFIATYNSKIISAFKKNGTLTEIEEAVFKNITSELIEQNEALKNFMQKITFNMLQEEESYSELRNIVQISDLAIIDITDKIQKNAIELKV